MVQLSALHFIYIQPPILSSKMTTQTKSHTKVAKLPSHPTFKEMIVNVMLLLKAETKDRKGHSLSTIVKKVNSTYQVNQANYETQTKQCLKRFLEDGTLEKVKGIGLSGSFKIGSSFKETGESTMTIKSKSPKKTSVKKATTANARSPAAAKRPAASARKAAGKKPSSAKPKAKDTKKKKPAPTKAPNKPAAKVKKAPARKSKTPKKAVEAKKN